MTQPELLRVLFVDDEPPLLQGMRAAMRRERKRWSMRFAEGAEKALELLADEPADVVISDMRMPGMDGAQFLSRVQELYPRTLRIILSGQADEEATVRAAPSAHQWLAKPTGREEVVSTIDRARAFLPLLRSDRLFEVVGGVRDLPAAPRLYMRLKQLLSSPETELDDVAGIIESDPAMCARMLQMCNSAFFSLPRSIADARDAVRILGVKTIEQLVLSAEVVRAMPLDDVPELSADALQQQALLVSRAALRVVDEDATAGCAGLLHDLGQLVLATRAPEDFRRALSESAASGRPLDEVELELLGATHADVGAATLALWGLPECVVTAVAAHHAPDRIEADEPDASAAVHIAQCLVEDALAELRGEAPPARLDQTLVARLGLTAQLEGWRDAVRSDIQQSELREAG
ncbi:MAG: response regulator [Planctomycetota bacterium]